ncbi:hypothetical protein Zm00014a_025231 [Zea mays]|jgi:hypothetical protein|uniref:Uncharacterized protein n=1 Tax=Zea mays TaxID=4577 RepID=A0A3L6FF88_MAIZE|nr:hypothetical protein Zm00014a_025231 [Zea mays]
MAAPLLLASACRTRSVSLALDAQSPSPGVFLSCFARQSRAADAQLLRAHSRSASRARCSLHSPGARPWLPWRALLSARSTQ